MAIASRTLIALYSPRRMGLGLRSGLSMLTIREAIDLAMSRA